MNIGFCGEPGSGKTTGVAFFSLLALESGMHSFGNFKIDHPNAKQVDLLNIIDMMRNAQNNPLNSPMYNAVLPMTEIYGTIESRVSSSSHVNLVFSYLIFQGRKLGFHIIYDAQLISSVDLRLRELTDVRFLCQKQKDGFLYSVCDKNFPSENVLTGKSFKLPLEVAQWVWSKYKSYEIIEPEGMDGFFFEMEKLSPKRFNGAIDRQVRLLRENNVRFCKSVAEVEDALLRLGEPVCFAKWVKVRL